MTTERERDARAKAHALMESEDGRCNFIDRGAWSGEHIPPLIVSHGMSHWDMWFSRRRAFLASAAAGTENPGAGT